MRVWVCWAMLNSPRLFGNSLQFLFLFSCRIIYFKRTRVVFAKSVYRHNSTFSILVAATMYDAEKSHQLIHHSINYNTIAHYHPTNWHRLSHVFLIWCNIYRMLRSNRLRQCVACFIAGIHNQLWIDTPNTDWHIAPKWEI